MQSKHALTLEQEGPTYDVFARVLRGLSNSKLAKPGKFRTADGLGYALRCSYKVALIWICTCRPRGWVAFEVGLTCNSGQLGPLAAAHTLPVGPLQCIMVT